MVPEALQRSRTPDSTATAARNSLLRADDRPLDLRNASVAIAAGRAIAEWDEFVASGATRHFGGSLVRAASPKPPERRDSLHPTAREIPEKLEALRSSVAEPLDTRKDSLRKRLPCRSEDLAQEADLMTIPEAAPYLRMHPAAARKLIREGGFPLPLVHHGQRQLVSRHLLERHLRCE